MTPFLQLIFILTLILFTAKLGGYLAVRAGQPSVLGELLVGVLLGPTLVNMLHFDIFSGQSAALSATLTEIGEIGVLFLMFIAGLELHLNELAGNMKVSALAGVLGVIFPAALGWGVGLLFGMSVQAAAFLGITLGATSVSISAQTLMEMKALRSRVGLGLLGAAVFDDILVILLLSIFFALTDGKADLGAIALVFSKMILFFALAAGFGLWALPRLVRRVRRMPISQNVLTLAIIIMFCYALAAEVVGGMAAITGTFLAGLMFARSPEKETIEPRIHALAYGFFVPVFFVNIGLDVDLKTMGASLGLALAVIIISIVGKLSGAGLGARMAGFSWRESLQVGTGMISRGEVGLIVAAVGIHDGLMTQDEFSAIIGMVIVTTLVTPPLLRMLFQNPQAAIPAHDVAGPTIQPGHTPTGQEEDAK